MRVYVIRHGESESNRDGVWTGWIDAPLTEKGRVDAAAVGVILSGVSFDKIYSSDLLRAKTTAAIAIPDCQYESRRELREVNVGNIAGKPLDIISNEERMMAAKEGYSAYGGETKAELDERIKSFAGELETSGFDRVAVFSHAGWLRGFLDVVVGDVLPRNKILCHNCTVGIFDFDGNLWRLHSWINLD